MAHWIAPGPPNPAKARAARRQSPMTEPLVAQCRALHVAKMAGPTELAAIHGMTIPAMWRILRNHTWYDGDYDPPTFRVRCATCTRWFTCQRVDQRFCSKPCQRERHSPARLRRERQHRRSFPRPREIRLETAVLDGAGDLSTVIADPRTTDPVELIAQAELRALLEGVDEATVAAMGDAELEALRARLEAWRP